MTKAEIKSLVTEILDGNELNNVIFEALLDLSQAIRERHRPWVILRSEDST